ncbi:ATP-binding protein [Streptosporangium lutulentum]|uniref:DNA-binding CsgD family transcriptional regulator n=1 Tax=Streptosporangium lutulentum TaxID=1461250 RepID=A0ABT9QQA3_9ACTN|nr:LuxR family transcriptional regulator [Streptosporangium lutulentum]MDP9848600.1 DNA-binding CsgD family transcriptional regulator [Streptosporangium lutulentum]
MAAYMPGRPDASEPAPLLGREDERLALDRLVETVGEGLSGALVLVGEAGIGKTRLLEYAADAAAAELQIARVSGVEPETRLAFAALHRLLLPFLDRADRLPGPQRDALGSAFGLVPGPPADRFLIGLATLTLLADVASVRPLMCLVDDAQWLDRESLEVLAFVGRRLHADGVGLLLTVRDEPTGTSALGGLPTFHVAGLAEPDARRLLTAVAGRLGPQVAERIVAEARGNPLALVELADELSGDQPLLPGPLPVGRRMEAHFLRQVRAMPAETQSLLLVASVAPPDDPAVLWRATALLGLSPEAADIAVSEGILSLRPDLVFRHPLIRSAVYAGARPADRRLVHKTLAAVIDRDRDPDRRAWHLASATVGIDEDVAMELERASERARSHGGYSAQGAFLLRAAELTPDPERRADRLFASARAHLVAGDPLVAQSLLERAVPGLNAPEMRAGAQQLRAAIEMFFARVTAVPSILLEAASTIGPLDGRTVRGMLFQALEAAMVARRYTTGTTLAEVARTALGTPLAPRARATIPDLLLDAFATRIAVGYLPAVPLLRAAIAALRTDSDLVEAGMPLAVLGWMATADLWDDRGLLAVVERLDTFDRDQGALHALRLTLLNLASCELWAGRFGNAEAHHAEATEIAVAVGLSADKPIYQVELLAWQGREAETRAVVDTVIGGWAEQRGSASTANHVLLSLTVLELSLGRYHEALACALRVYDDDEPGVGSLILPDVVEAGVRAGDRAAASAALARLSERATASGTSWALGMLARSRALMADDDHAEVLYGESVEHLGRTLVATELARAHLLYGEWLRRRGRRSDARDRLRIAYDMFAAMGASAFAERARVELLATGERARKRTEQTDHHLTPQETQVAGLAAGGATNAEIATRLFITASTVEYHLNKVFRKLGITSRRQLARTLHDEPAPGDA